MKLGYPPITTLQAERLSSFLDKVYLGKIEVAHPQGNAQHAVANTLGNRLSIREQ